MKISEKTIEAAILRTLNLLPKVFAFKTMDQKAFRNGSYQKGSSFQIRGVSDIICLAEGKVFFLEVKTKSGEQSIYQKAFEAKVRATGNIYAVVRSPQDALEIINPYMDQMR